MEGNLTNEIARQQARFREEASALLLEIEGIKGERDELKALLSELIADKQFLVCLIFLYRLI